MGLGTLPIPFYFDRSIQSGGAGAEIVERTVFSTKQHGGEDQYNIEARVYQLVMPTLQQPEDPIRTLTKIGYVREGTEYIYGTSTLSQTIYNISTIASGKYWVEDGDKIIAIDPSVWFSPKLDEIISEGVKSSSK